MFLLPFNFLRNCKVFFLWPKASRQFADGKKLSAYCCLRSSKGDKGAALTKYHGRIIFVQIKYFLTSQMFLVHCETLERCFDIKIKLNYLLTPSLGLMISCTSFSSFLFNLSGNFPLSFNSAFSFFYFSTLTTYSLLEKAFRQSF